MYLILFPKVLLSGHGKDLECTDAVHYNTSEKPSISKLDIDKDNCRYPHKGIVIDELGPSFSVVHRETPLKAGFVLKKPSREILRFIKLLKAFHEKVVVKSLEKGLEFKLDGGVVPVMESIIKVFKAEVEKSTTYAAGRSPRQLKLGSPAPAAPITMNTTAVTSHSPFLAHTSWQDARPASAGAELFPLVSEAKAAAEKTKSSHKVDEFAQAFALKSNVDDPSPSLFFSEAKAGEKAKIDTSKVNSNDMSTLFSTLSVTKASDMKQARSVKSACENISALFPVLPTNFQRTNSTQAPSLQTNCNDVPSKAGNANRLPSSKSIDDSPSTAPTTTKTNVTITPHPPSPKADTAKVLDKFALAHTDKISNSFKTCSSRSKCSSVHPPTPKAAEEEEEADWELVDYPSNKPTDEYVFVSKAACPGAGVVKNV